MTISVKPLVIIGQHGLGDSIYARPFIRAASKRRPTYLQTPWPELFADLPVSFVRPSSRLRTQAKNIERQPRTLWTDAPVCCDVVKLAYGHADFAAGHTIAQAIEQRLPLEGAPFVFGLPPMGPAISRAKPIALVRPVTVRSEWRNEARNPLPEYVAHVAQSLMDTHHVVVVADLSPGFEWLEGELPPHHEAFVQGEFNVRQLLALAGAADVIVGGVGWIVPAALALRRPAFVILGGQGQHNSPERITDPRMNTSLIGFAKPERYCQCANMTHKCDKKIPNLQAQWVTWRNGRTYFDTTPTAI